MKSPDVMSTKTAFALPTSQGGSPEVSSLPDGGFRLARRAIFALATATALGAAALFISALWGHGPTGLIVLAAILFTIGTGWISLAFWTTLAGFLALRLIPASVSSAAPPSATPTERGGRTVVAIAVHNEDPAMVAGNIATMYHSVNSAGLGEDVDFFILSDTTDPDLWIAEEKAWARLCTDLKASGRIFYRKRPDTAGRKSGNIAEFCRRWGRRYRYMVILDADSLMDGRTIAALIARMDASPNLALLQTAPAIVNGHSLFTRLLQFAGGVYGPVFSTGLAIMSGPHGNSWGHNAIIRISPFLQHCGLPRLRGKAPMGGDILSHDFVEAALLVRGGWDVRIAPDLGGSFEECPTTMADFARRDRRWCQGNLQHLRVLFIPRLAMMSRHHLISGIMSYAISPIWLGFIASGLLLAVSGGSAADIPTVAGPLLALVIGLLVGPRLLGLIDFLLRRRTTSRARHAARSLSTLVSTPLEIIITALLAPILMVHQTLAVFSVLAGQAVGWTAQRRSVSRSLVRDQARLAIAPVLLGLGIATLLALGADSQTPTDQVSANLIWANLIWGAPVAIPLLAAPILITVADSRRAGRWCRAMGLFTAPTERDEPSIVRTALDGRHALAGPGDSHPDGLREVLSDPALNAMHRLVLDVCHAGRIAADADTFRGADLLTGARQRLAAGQPLDRAEKMALLTDPDSLTLGMTR